MKDFITFEKFRRYEIIRISGVTNMLDIDAVIFYSFDELTEDDIIEIITNYKDYYHKFSERLNSDSFFKASLEKIRRAMRIEAKRRTDAKYRK